MAHINYSVSPNSSQIKRDGGVKMDKFTHNLRKLIEIQGLSAAMGSISAMLTYDIKTIEELNDSIVDEIYYSLEQLESY